MPIYAYRCTTCGHAQDVLQKVSDPLLTVCPACGAATFAKQITAAGFQLKGSGWYATDFKGGGKKPAEAKPEAKAEGKTEAKTETKTEARTEGKTEGKTEAKPEKKKPATTAN
jgi:putative FmdB family regulatory protein